MRIAECGIKSEKSREDLGRLAVVRFMGERGQGRGLEVDLDHVGPPPPGNRRQRGRGLNHHRGADHEEHVATLREIGCLLQGLRRQRLAEPDHVGPEQPAAPASGRKGLQGHLVVLRDPPLVEAAHAPQISVQLHQPDAPRQAVQPIHVLRDQQELGRAALQEGDGPMRRVGLAPGDELPPGIVPFPHQLGIPVERLGGRQILGPELAPQPAGPSKRRHPALGGHPGAGQDRHPPRLGEPLLQL